MKSACSFWNCHFWVHLCISSFCFFSPGCAYRRNESPSFYAVLYWKGQKLGVCSLCAAQWVRLLESRDETVFVLKALMVSWERQASEDRPGVRGHCHLLVGAGCSIPLSPPQSCLNALRLTGNPIPSALWRRVMTPAVWLTTGGRETCDHHEGPAWWIMPTPWFRFDPLRWEAGWGQKRDRIDVQGSRGTIPQIPAERFCCILIRRYRYLLSC